MLQTKEYLDWNEYQEFIKFYNRLGKFKHIFQRRSLFSFFSFEEPFKKAFTETNIMGVEG